MKGLIGSGLCLALGLLAARSVGEEIQWRPAAPMAAAPMAAAPNQPVAHASYTAGGTGLGISLSRPIPAQPTAENQDTALGFRPSLDRPTPLIRFQAADLAQPLPQGPALKTDKGKPEPKPQVIPRSELVKPQPMPLESQFVPGMPSPVYPGPVSSGPIYSSPMSDSCGCGTGGPLWSSHRGADLMDDGCGCGCYQDPCCECDTGCCPGRGRFWVNASYLLWAFERKNIPPLVTSSPVNTPRNQSGVLGFLTTTTVIGEDDQETSFHNGGRLNFGFWFPHHDNFGLEAGFLFLGKRSRSITVGGQGNPQFARPLIVDGQEVSQLLTFPGVVIGAATVDMYSHLWGLEGNLRQKICCGPRYWVDFLYGYRHLDLREGITITENLQQAEIQDIFVQDQFRTRNYFDGPQFGIQGECQFGRRWFIQGTFKIAAGNMHQVVDISGATQVIPAPPGTTGLANSGILANAFTNTGIFTDNRFAVVPELGLKLGFDINDHWRLWVGYDFLFMSSVVRPGDQIDRRINPTLVPFAPVAPNPNPAVPAVLFRTTSFWAQGVSFGVEYRY